jgi:hypothetical protein
LSLLSLLLLLLSVVVVLVVVLVVVVSNTRCCCCCLQDVFSHHTCFNTLSFEDTERIIENTHVGFPCIFCYSHTRYCPFYFLVGRFGFGEVIHFTEKRKRHTLVVGRLMFWLLWCCCCVVLSLLLSLLLVIVLVFLAGYCALLLLVVLVVVVVVLAGYCAVAVVRVMCKYGLWSCGVGLPLTAESNSRSILLLFWLLWCCCCVVCLYYCAVTVVRFVCGDSLCSSGVGLQLTVLQSLTVNQYCIALSAIIIRRCIPPETHGSGSAHRRILLVWALLVAAHKYVDFLLSKNPT